MTWLNAALALGWAEICRSGGIYPTCLLQHVARHLKPDLVARRAMFNSLSPTGPPTICRARGPRYLATSRTFGRLSSSVAAAWAGTGEVGR